MKFKCIKPLTIGRFQIFEGAEARLKHITYSDAPELAIFKLFFKEDSFTLDLPQSVLIRHFEPIIDN